MFFVFSDSDTEFNIEGPEEPCIFSAIEPHATDLVLPPRPGTNASNDITEPAMPHCTCELNNGVPCVSIFTQETLIDCRMQYETMTREERDIAILAKIECGMHMGSTTERSKHKKQGERKHTRNDYYFRGRRICRTIFQYIHGIGETQLDKLNKHYRDEGVVPRVHGLKGKLPAKALSFEDTRRVVDFIVNYSNTHSVTLPGRTPSHWKSDAKLLPTNCTKKTVYDEYAKVRYIINKVYEEVT